MCPPKAPKVEAAKAPAPPATPATTETPDVAYNEDDSPASRRRLGRIKLRTDKTPTAPQARTGVQLPRIKSVV